MPKAKRRDYKSGVAYYGTDSKIISHAWYTLRETASLAGCHYETVRKYLDQLIWRRRGGRDILIIGESVLRLRDIFSP